MEGTESWQGMDDEASLVNILLSVLPFHSFMVPMYCSSKLPKMVAKQLLWSQRYKHIWSPSTSQKDLGQGHLHRIRETHESKVNWPGAFFADFTRCVGVGVLELLELLGTLKPSWSMGAFEHREVTVAVGKHDLVQQRDHRKTFQHTASSCKRHPRFVNV